MRRYWVPESQFSGNHVLLEGDIFHHVCVVCRQGLGDRFEILAHGKAHWVEIKDVKKKSAIAEVLEVRELTPLKEPTIHLALSLPKFATLEKVLEKSVELGVHSIHLFHSDFSFAKASQKELNSKWSRWQKIIQGATQQTGRGHWLNLTEIRPLSVLLSEYSSRKQVSGILAYEGEGLKNFKESLESRPQDLKEVWLFVGSEGGFSAEDLKLFKDYKLLPVSLGDQVLRVETACVTLISILKYGLGQFD